MANNSIVDHSKIQRKLYSVNIDLIDDGILESIPEMSIMNLAIEYNYRENFFPIVKLNLTISEYLYKLILYNRNSIKFRLILTSFIKDTKLKTDDQDFLINKKVIFDEIFQPFIPNVNDDDKKEELNLEKDANEPNKPLDLYLFKLDTFNINKKIINFIAQDCKVKDAIGYTLKTLNVKNVLMSTPQVNTRYEQIIVPPLNLKNAIQHLADTYGIYNNGLREFYDFDYLYILRDDLSDIPVVNSDFVNVYVNVTKIAQDDGSVNIGGYKDTENNCYIVNINNLIDVIKNENSNKEINGNKLRVYDRNTLENSLVYDKGSNKFKINKSYNEKTIGSGGYNGADKISYIFNNGDNNTLINKYEKQTTYSNIELNVHFITLDLDIFKINRQYIFNFEDSKFAAKYNGIYMLDYLVAAMVQQSGEIQASAKFRKVK